jgi:hypothetical protein
MHGLESADEARVATQCDAGPHAREMREHGLSGGGDGWRMGVATGKSEAVHVLIMMIMRISQNRPANPLDNRVLHAVYIEQERGSGPRVSDRR